MKWIYSKRNCLVCRLKTTILITTVIIEFNCPSNESFLGDSDKEALAFMKQLALNQCHESQQEKITVYFITAINTKKMHKCFGELFKTIKESKNR